MRICYDKLRKLMIDNKKKRCNLIRTAEINEYTATKINKDEPISMEKNNANMSSLSLLHRKYLRSYFRRMGHESV